MTKPEAGPITCRDTTWLVSDARDRALTDEEKAALAGHIATCSLCQGASTQFEMLFRQLDHYLAGKNEGGSS
jgi:hypothetical protein